MSDPTEPRIELAQRAVRDLRKMTPEGRRRVRAALEGLVAGEPNADVKSLSGYTPWMRLRAGDFRVLYRPLTPDDGLGEGILVARVVDRRDLQRAVATLT